MKVSEIIYKARKAKKMTQAALAERVGVTTQAVSQWENDVTRPNILTASRIAVELDLERDWLLNEDWMPADLRAKINNRLPKSRYASAYQGFIPVIKMKDSIHFVRNMNFSKAKIPEHLSLVQPTKPYKGYHFAVELGNEPLPKGFDEGDLCIFSCGLFPDDGDYVIAQVEELPNDQCVFGEFTLIGDDPFAWIHAAPDADAYRGTGVNGTMIEHRRFRIQKDDDVTDETALRELEARKTSSAT